MPTKVLSPRVLVVVLIAAGALGCTRSPVGKDCHVYFRHDILGAAGDHPRAALIDEVNGARVSVVGTLKRADADWVVVEGSTHVNVGAYFVPEQRETWIPRSNVLAIEVVSKKAELSPPVSPP